MYEDDIRICHCVKTDCSNCPMRNIGTAGIKYEQAHRDGKLGEIIEHEKQLIEQEQITKTITINWEINKHVI
mgnify:CR=1 FL=1